MGPDATFAVVTFPAAELKGNDFLGFFIRVNDFGGHARTGNVWFADLNVVAISNQQHVGERNLRAFDSLDKLDFKHVTGLDAILFGTCSNNCVHGIILSALERVNISKATAFVNVYFCACDNK